MEEGWARGRQMPPAVPARRAGGQPDAGCQLPVLPRAVPVLNSLPGSELPLCAQTCNLTFPPPAVPTPAAVLAIWDLSSSTQAGESWKDPPTDASCQCTFCKEATENPEGE